jgi:hypothetical protein
MDMTPDQMVEFLAGAFKEIERETLLLVLQANRYNLDAALEALIAMESGNQEEAATSVQAPELVKTETRQGMSWISYDIS